MNERLPNPKLLLARLAQHALDIGARALTECESLIAGLAQTRETAQHSQHGGYRYFDYHDLPIPACELWRPTLKLSFEVMWIR